MGALWRGQALTGEINARMGDELRQTHERGQAASWALLRPERPLL